MRVSSLTLSTAALAGIQNEQAAIARLSHQIAANERILAPKDDPVRAPRILELADRIALREQYLINQDKAEQSLRYQNAHLQQIRRVLEHARGLLANISPNHELGLRTQHSELMHGDYLQLKALVNARDPSGNYIFAGNETDTEPYSHTEVWPGPGSSGASSYAGDDGVRRIRIDSGRELQVSDVLTNVMDVNLSTDLLQGLNNVALALRSTSLSQSQLDDALTRIDLAMQALGEIERRNAAALQEVLDTRAQTRALLNEEKNALGKLTELDQAAAIVELQRRQVTLEAAQRAYARTSGLSLFNYL